MRRLPVYLLLDTSGSMTGEPIEAVKNGVQTLVSALRTDPYALETAFLSVITFDSSVKQVVPLIELAAFQAPGLSASGGTSLGAGLMKLAECIDKEVAKTTADIKGDWKPLVFLMTDGEPTDDWQKGLAEFKKRKVGMVITCGAGPNVNTNTLKQISEIVVLLATADQNSIKAFFKWVSASISTSSAKIDTNGTEIKTLGELPPPPPEVNIVV
jgi:uncharacterized protein YegL